MAVREYQAGTVDVRATAPLLRRTINRPARRNALGFDLHTFTGSSEVEDPTLPTAFLKLIEQGVTTPLLCGHQRGDSLRDGPHGRPDVLPAVHLHALLLPLMRLWDVRSPETLRRSQPR